MYQPPQNPNDNFYNDQTQGYPQYPQQPPYQGFPPPPGLIQQPQKKPGLLGRFRTMSKKKQAGVGCLASIIVLSMCICTASMANAGSNNNQVQTSPTTQTTQLAQVATKAPTPTAKPVVHHVAKPTPKPTQKPIVQATQAPVVVKPTPKPQPKPAPTQAPPVGVNGNPWGYDFSPGNLIYNPPANFCDYFNCIPSFWSHTNGYIDECNDGSYSHSGGVRGACSYHGGEMRPLYSH